jgi:hypothetical protein
MLTALDETLVHQTPDTFGQVFTSDHRFFDRTWFGVYSPDGAIGLITGIGAYANMNVLDGFAAVQAGGKQHNLRLSRPLRPAVADITLGPLRHEVVEPLWRHRLVLEPGSHGTAFDLLWEGVAPAHLEPPHAARLDGRIYQDYKRFDQAGTVSGWVQVGESRVEADGWFAARDHSWGIRRQVGGFEPFTGSLPPEVNGVLFIWCEFAADGVTGHVQVQEDGQGQVVLSEGFVAPDGASPVEVGAVEHDIEFHPGTRAYRRARLVLHGVDGTRWEITAEPLLTAWAYRGTGYDGGYADGRGLGAYRGDHAEHDVYDLSHPEDVGLPDGSTIVPFHREQGVRLEVNGARGFGHLPIMPIGRVERYGLGV